MTNELSMSIPRLVAFDLDAVSASPAKARTMVRHQLRRRIEHVAQEPETASCNGVIFRFNRKTLFSAAAQNHAARNGDDAAQFRQKAADAVRLIAAQLLFRFR